MTSGEYEILMNLYQATMPIVKKKYGRQSPNGDNKRGFLRKSRGVQALLIINKYNGVNQRKIKQNIGYTVVNVDGVEKKRKEGW